MPNTPTCYVIAGPNGAGKTTFALRHLSKSIGCGRFINADMIAAGLAPLAPDAATYTAGRLFLSELQRCITSREDFAFETTLAGRTYVRTLQNLHKEHWHIVLFYLWIPSAKFSAARVQQRVDAGGHNIPPEAIKRRYAKSLRNLFLLYIPFCDEVYCFNHSTPLPEMMFKIDENGFEIRNYDLCQLLKEYDSDNRF